MSGAVFRVGTVTNVKKPAGLNYDASGGVVTVRVKYDDLSSTTRELQLLGGADIPEVGDIVLTLHMTTGSSKGFVLGRYFTMRSDIPYHTKRQFLEWQNEQDLRLKNLEQRVAALEALPSHPSGSNYRPLIYGQN